MWHYTATSARLGESLTKVKSALFGRCMTQRNILSPHESSNQAFPNLPQFVIFNRMISFIAYSMNINSLFISKRTHSTNSVPVWIKLHYHTNSHFQNLNTLISCRRDHNCRLFFFAILLNPWRWPKNHLQLRISRTNSLIQTTYPSSNSFVLTVEP